MLKSIATFVVSFAFLTVAQAEPPKSKWRSVEIDTIQIGYGLQMTDVNGDGKTDFIGRATLVAGQTEFTWQISPESNSRTNAYVRLRIRKIRDNLPDFMAYTNAIRFEFL